MPNADDRRKHIEDATALPVAEHHLDQARTYLIEAADDQTTEEEAQTLSALAAAHVEIGKLEVISADTRQAVDEAAALVEDRIIYSLNLDEVPALVLSSLNHAEGLQQLAGDAAEVVAYAFPAGTLRTMLEEEAEVPHLIAGELGCNVYTLGGMVWLGLPRGDWQDVAAGIRRLVDWWLYGRDEPDTEEPEEDEPDEE